ncbi:MAG: helix-turn-helix domain-containing protein [Pseudomonadota bacterium]
MSNSVTTACRAVQISPSQKSVLMCLADRSDDSGLSWPSIPGIGEWTCLCRTAVIQGLKGLEEAGIVTITKVCGKNNRCLINLARLPDLVNKDQSVRHTRAADTPVRQTYPTGPADAPLPVRQTDYTRAADTPEASVSIKETPGKHQKTRASKSHGLPEGFAVSERVRDWAAEKGFADLDDHLEYFVSYAKANGKKYVDWDEALMNAIRGNWAKVPGQGLNSQEILEKRNRAAASKWSAAAKAIFDPAPAAGLFSGSLARRSRHAGFQDLDYREGVDADGRID